MKMMEVTLLAALCALPFAAGAQPWPVEPNCHCLNEIAPNSADLRQHIGEWVEIKNPYRYPMDVAALTIYDNSGTEAGIEDYPHDPLVQGMTIPAGGYAVVMDMKDRGVYREGVTYQQVLDAIRGAGMESRVVLLCPTDDAIGNGLNDAADRAGIDGYVRVIRPEGAQQILVREEFGWGAPVEDGYSWTYTKGCWRYDVWTPGCTNAGALAAQSTADSPPLIPDVPEHALITSSGVEGEVRITVEPEEVQPGEEVTVTVEVEARYESSGDDALFTAEATECLPDTSCPDFEGEGSGSESFTWVPTREDIGGHDVCYEARDENGETFAEECARVRVLEPGLPSVSDLWLNSRHFHPGRRFTLECGVFNPSIPRELNVYIALEVYGDFFFWPSWSTGVDYENIYLGADESWGETILDFIWPYGAGEGEAAFWAVVEDGETGEFSDARHIDFDWSGYATAGAIPAAGEAIEAPAELLKRLEQRGKPLQDRRDFRKTLLEAAGKSRPVVGTMSAVSTKTTPK